MATLTPAQKALAKASQINADLGCATLQEALTTKAISGAQRSLTVRATTREARVGSAIQDALTKAAAMRALPASDRTLLETKPATKSETKGNGKRKSVPAPIAPVATDASVQ